MLRRWRRLWSERGSAVAEYLVALMIVGLGAIAIVAALVGALRATHQSEMQRVSDIVQSGY